MNKKILIVEDDQDILFALSSLLEDEGYTVQVAANGLMALELIRTHGLPDIILLDMIMPVMNGWEFALKFRALYDHQCPIIVMTAAADAQQRAFDVGAVGWIAKPFVLERLFKMIQEHIVTPRAHALL